MREDLFSVIAMPVGHPWYGAKGVGISYPSWSDSQSVHVPNPVCCDMNTNGGRWTLVWRKQSAGFIGVNASTGFNSSCAGATVRDCDSVMPPAMMWREAMTRFEDTDAYAAVVDQMEERQRACLNGYPWQDTTATADTRAPG